MWWMPSGLSESEVQEILERWSSSTDPVASTSFFKKRKTTLRCKTCSNEVPTKDAYIYINDIYGLHMKADCLEPYFDSIMKNEATINQFFRKDK